MFFLLRIAFWLSIVLILLPSGSAQHAPPSNVGASEAISAASATVADMRGFCTRQPDACTVGSQVAVSLGYRAQAGAKMLYDFLTEALAPKETGALLRGPLRAAVAEAGPVKSSPPRRIRSPRRSCPDMARAAAAQRRRAAAEITLFYRIGGMFHHGTARALDRDRPARPRALYRG